MQSRYKFNDKQVHEVMTKWLMYYEYALLNTSEGLVLDDLQADVEPEPVTEYEVVARFSTYIGDKLDVTPLDSATRSVWEKDREVLMQYMLVCKQPKY